MKRKFPKLTFTPPDAHLEKRLQLQEAWAKDALDGEPLALRMSDDFEGIDLSGRNLSGARLYAVAGERVYKKTFLRCNFENTVMIGARTNGARWVGCPVTGAKITGSGVTPEQFKNCPGSETLFPKPKRKKISAPEPMHDVA